MDPNNNQVNNQQANQPVINQQQAVPVSQNPTDTTAQQGMPYQNPNSNGHKTIILLVVLLILVVGLTSYLIFVNMQNISPQKLPASNVQVIPSTPTATPVAEDDLSVEDPEIDIKALDDAASTL